MLVEGRHFFADVDPHALGHKALAVNLSDLAAMGAAPHAFTLALALPRADERWLAAFSDGLFALAERFGCELIGGDTTSGPLNICITVFGDVPPNAALRRDAAKPGDDIWVSGTLGDARAGLGLLRGEWTLADDAATAQLKRALERPEPRVALGLALRGVAHAALDISDGLAGDLLHILKRSNAQAVVDVRRGPDLPPRSRRCPPKRAAPARSPAATTTNCASPRRPGRAKRSSGSASGRTCRSHASVQSSAIDSPADAPSIAWRDRAGAPLSLTLQGFDHFHAD